MTGTVRSGEVDIEIELAALASELGFRADEYEIEDVWIADAEEGVLEIDVRGELIEEDDGLRADGGAVQARSGAEDGPKSLELSDIEVAEVHTTEPDRIIERNHYLESSNPGARHRFLITGGLMHGVVGAAMWGRPVAREINQESVVELTRFWTADWTPHNAESYALAQMMREMERQGYDRLVAYASVGRHEGTIYRATNWMNLGLCWPASWDNRDGREMRDHGVKWKFEYVFEPGWFLPDGRRINCSVDTGTSRSERGEQP